MSHSEWHSFDSAEGFLKLLRKQMWGWCHGNYSQAKGSLPFPLKGRIIIPLKATGDLLEIMRYRTSTDSIQKECGMSWLHLCKPKSKPQIHHWGWQCLHLLLRSWESFRHCGILCLAGTVSTCWYQKEVLEIDQELAWGLVCSGKSPMRIFFWTRFENFVAKATKN